MPKVETIKIACTALTPIWTGDPNGKGGQILETGTLGSMRWWYEMALLGLGVFACDPTNNGCKLEASDYKTNPDESLKKLCPACLLFGCTGWKRRFLLRVETVQSMPYTVQSLGGSSHSNVTWQKKMLKMEHSEYSLPIGPFTLIIQPHKNWEATINQQLVAILTIMSKMGAIGAKTQNGFGQFTIDDPNQNLTLDDAKNQIQAFAKGQNRDAEVNSTDPYSLKSYWGYTFSDIDVTRLNSIMPIQFGSNCCYPVSFDVRTSVKIEKETDTKTKGIRFKYKNSLVEAHRCKNKGDYGRHKTCKQCNQQVEKLFGNLDHAGQIFVSHPFKPASQNKATLRVWGLTTTEDKEALYPILKDQMSSIFGLSTIERIQNPFFESGESANV